MNTHGIDLAALTRIQLHDLASDVARELEFKEHDDRIQLEEKLKSVVEAAGFDPKELEFGRSQKRGRKPAAKKAKENVDEH